jgi:restriction endonuclease Mrr
LSSAQFFLVLFAGELFWALVQAKRWKGTVSRPEVQAFAGSMEGHKAKKGVMITTSAFSGGDIAISCG